MHYDILFRIRNYFKILSVGLLVAFGTAVWFYYVYKTPGFSLYGGHLIRWLLFFDFMLLGAQMGSVRKDIRVTPVVDACLLLLSIACFYALFIAGLRIKSVAFLQFFSFIPLLCAIYSTSLARVRWQSVYIKVELVTSLLGLLVDCVLKYTGFNSSCSLTR